jgi:hypothetical protein
MAHSAELECGNYVFRVTTRRIYAARDFRTLDDIERKL